MKRIYSIMLLITFLTVAAIASVSTVKLASAQAGPYYAVEPSQVLMGPSLAIGQEFNVTLKLYNVTTQNVPAGVQGIEVHFTWNSTLIQPVSFVSDVGISGVGPLTTGILYGISPGFLDSQGNPIASAPYTNATHYEVAGAATGLAWWGDNATIAVITFQVVSQPSPYAICPLACDFTDMTDANSATPVFSVQNAVYTITTEQTVPYTITFEGVDYSGTIDTDSNVTAPVFDNNTSTFNFTVTSPVNGTVPGFCNVTFPNNFMWSQPVQTNWTVTIDNNPDAVVTTDSANAYVWFNFTAGTHEIVIYSTNSVPEFPVTGLLLLLMGTTLIGAAATTRLRKKPSYS
jgi:hypothetical protein